MIKNTNLLGTNKQLEAMGIPAHRPFTTRPNNGVIKNRYGILYNKCFFIAIEHGILQHARKFVPAYQIVKYYIDNGIIGTDDLFDTSIPGHNKMAQSIAINNGLRIEMYPVKYENNKRYISTEPFVVFNGRGRITIKIANSESHFELIDSIGGTVILNATIVDQKKELAKFSDRSVNDDKNKGKERSGPIDNKRKQNNQVGNNEPTSEMNSDLIERKIKDQQAILDQIAMKHKQVDDDLKYALSLID